MNATEEKTVRKAVAGDRAAFRELVLANSHAIFRLAWRLCGEESAAEDIVQEAFIKAWRKIGDFRFQSSFRTWLQRITINTAMDYLRRQSRRRQFEAAEPDWERLPQGEVPAKEDVRIDIREQTRAAMRKLTDTERSAFLLRHYEGHSIREIAQMLDLTTGACKQTIFRAVRKMRAELQPLVTT